ncbi:GNAT family N-acetyltransferase [Aeromicrobium fastidiosum]|uniref:GNAT family N-acetyltransferase n=1 Tax=Aeromicrobium fastidiosum TaxID=52699 RepID=A0A641ANU6_9ACTN|nr:GNAT family protein [Aeromicrobium fastidiosum]KAA1379764.1 GNAT family N-acetyltransferase [Aeromicrobium fastidiosum]MBP2389254.1 RimJ/RimL family protein N-acetyltransferase [Aeromicrobium fastidiosum]
MDAGHDFTATPVLAGRLVRLEPLTPEHAPDVLAAADDDEVFRWLPFVRPRTLAEAETLVSRYLDGPTVPWVQVDAAAGDVIGMTTFYDVDAAMRTVAIGWTWLARRAWRTGVNTEAKLLLMRRAFDDLGCVRVVWHTDIRNERSQAAIARLGAQREGVMRKHKLRPDGSWRDTVTFSMLDDEWPAARAALEARLGR